MQKQRDMLDAREQFILGFSLTTLGLLYVLGTTGYSALLHLQGIPTNLFPPEWGIATVINSGATAFWWYFSWPAWVQWQTRLTPAGITQARFFGWRVIRWSEVTRIEIVQTKDIKISAPHEQIVIKPILILDARALLEDMRLYLPAEQVPELAIPTRPI
jgi:hypothetical protein